MKTTLAVLWAFALLLTAAQASPVTIYTNTMSPPLPGHAATWYLVEANPTTPFYKLIWIVPPTGAPYATGFDKTGHVRYDGTSISTANGLYCATTYAEIQAKATALGITNLPAQVTGQP